MSRPQLASAKVTRGPLGSSLQLVFGDVRVFDVRLEPWSTPWEVARALRQLADAVEGDPVLKEAWSNEP